MSLPGQQLFNRSYVYDNLNRISTMTETASALPCKGLSWTIDQWGNMSAQTPTSGSGFSFSGGTPSTNNQLSAYTYDPAGNVTYDGTHHYLYNAEGRVLQVDSGNTATYVYNENGQRVRKNVSGSWTEYFYDIDGNVQSELVGPAWTNQYIYSGDSLLAIYTNGTTEFIHPDHLGSTRLVTGVSQNIIDNLDYYPYGQQFTGDTATTHKFTGKERDTETGHDNFLARYYSGIAGRFMSPDWMSEPDPIPYADVENPQTLNLYSYVGNNPLSDWDDDGHQAAPAVNCSGWLCWLNHLLGGGSGPAPAPAFELMSGFAKGIANQGRSLWNSTHFNDPNQQSMLPLNDADEKTGAFLSLGVTLLIPDGGDTIEIHHLLPQAEEFRPFFTAAGLDVEDEAYKIPLTRSRHRLKPNGIHAQGAEGWNQTWRAWIAKNPGASKQRILAQLARMRKAFGI